MEEHIVYFDSANDANGYDINDIPFICSIKYDKKFRNLRTRKEDKYLRKLNDGTVVISDRLTFISTGNSTIGLVSKSTYHNIEYSKDKITWNELTTATTVNLADKERVYLRGVLESAQTYEDYTQFKMTGSIAAKGNINCLWDYENTDAPLKDYCGRRLFFECSSLTNMPELPSKSLATYCYDNMFRGCTNLTTTSELPATILYDYCYRSMFSGCTSLITVSKISAKELAYLSCGYMFGACTSLITAPELPATTLSDYCYCGMFQGCTSLATAPELPATTLSDYCYYAMFYNCTSLVNATELPSTSLGKCCYEYMYGRCTSLVNAPEILPAMILSEGDYDHPAYINDGGERNNHGCYSYMFYGCSSLLHAPILPAPKVEKSCYLSMFYDCSSLQDIYLLADSIQIEGEENEFIKQNSACIWMVRGAKGEGQSGTPTPQNSTSIYLAPGVQSEWQQIANHYSHTQYFYTEELTREQVDEILEHYHLK